MRSGKCSISISNGRISAIMHRKYAIIQVSLIDQYFTEFGALVRSFDEVFNIRPWMSLVSIQESDRQHFPTQVCLARFSILCRTLFAPMRRLDATRGAHHDRDADTNPGSFGEL